MYPSPGSIESDHANPSADFAVYTTGSHGRDDGLSVWEDADNHAVGAVLDVDAVPGADEVSVLAPGAAPDVDAAAVLAPGAAPDADAAAEAPGAEDAEAPGAEDAEALVLDADLVSDRVLV